MQPRWQPSLDDYIDMAAYLLGVDRAAIIRLPRLALAESALHAPFASFGRVEAYPTLVEQAAVLLVHLARNHPLPDANKRAAFLLMARFLDGAHPTSRRTQAWSSASPLAKPSSKRSSNGFADAATKPGADLARPSPDRFERDSGHRAAILCPSGGNGRTPAWTCGSGLRHATISNAGMLAAAATQVAALLQAAQAFPHPLLAHARRSASSPAVTNANCDVHPSSARSSSPSRFQRRNRLSQTNAAHQLTATVANNEVHAPLRAHHLRDSPPATSWHLAVPALATASALSYSSPSSLCR